jgi:hypothetical protein
MTRKLTWFALLLAARAIGGGEFDVASGGNATGPGAVQITSGSGGTDQPVFGIPGNPGWSFSSEQMEQSNAAPIPAANVHEPGGI